jgi:hypothetical protein
MAWSVQAQLVYNLADDFNRSNSYALGTTSSGNSTWNENEAAGHPEQLQISGNRLWCITGGVTGPEPTGASIDLAAEMPGFDMGSGDYGWAFHLDLNRNPSGWSSDRYGLGFILCANEPLFSSTTVDGWAVIWTELNDELILGRFSDDMLGLNPLTAVIHTGLDWDVCSLDGINIRVEVTPAGNWTLWWEDGLPIANPLNIDAHVATSVTPDLTYFNEINLKYAGPAWAHNTSTSSGSDASFENLYLGSVLPGPPNPVNFNASTFSMDQISLEWSLNDSNDPVMVAWSPDGTFGSPIGTYAAGDTILGGGRVLYAGPGLSFQHAGLPSGTRYYYSAWSFSAEGEYSSGFPDSVFTMFPEPTAEPDGLVAACNGPSYVTVSWTDSDADHYLVKGSTAGFNAITAPVDGMPEPDALLVRNIEASVQQHRFTGLEPETQYFFRVYPYNGLGGSVDYKTEGAIPQASAFTTEINLNLFISEVADPIQSNMRFVELYNAGPAGIDFGLDSVFFCRQSNGSPASWGSVPLTGTLPPGNTYVISYLANYFDTAYYQSADKYSSLVNISGNDGVFLFYGGNQTGGFLLDAYGQVDVNGDTTAWLYSDGHAVRKRNIAVPNTTWQPGEWVILKDLPYTGMTPGIHQGLTTWQGITSNEWNRRGNNWSGTYGYVPDASYMVSIPDTPKDPVITGPAACHQVMVGTGAVLSVQNTGSLQVSGQ